MLTVCLSDLDGVPESKSLAAGDKEFDRVRVGDVEQIEREERGLAVDATDKNAERVIEVLAVSLRDCRGEAEFETDAEADNVKRAEGEVNVLAVLLKDCLGDEEKRLEMDEVLEDHADMLVGAPL